MDVVINCGGMREQFRLHSEFGDAISVMFNLEKWAPWTYWDIGTLGHWDIGTLNVQKRSRTKHLDILLSKL
ncbi:unnamed protein product [Ambrosiozyma monospora]|uniref:Unnamed protein product n=1 Tax=Ambrosiozyma monospora TaxID=43982 RepID=A0ACB5TGJ1_AMBMO|nr:unnamed protein product [Ambrosiozyma monospora]